jgi:hypothetical protein
VCFTLKTAKTLGINTSLTWRHFQAREFMSAIGAFETSTDVRYLAAFGGKADISQRLPNNRDL